MWIPVGCYSKTPTCHKVSMLVSMAGYTRLTNLHTNHLLLRHHARTVSRGVDGHDQHVIGWFHLRLRSFSHDFIYHRGCQSHGPLFPGACVTRNVYFSDSFNNDLNTISLYKYQTTFSCASSQVSRFYSEIFTYIYNQKCR